MSEPIPAVTNEQRLQILNLRQALEILQLRAHVVNLELAARLRELEIPGYDLNVGTFTYTKTEGA